MADIAPTKKFTAEGIPYVEWADITTSTDTPLKFALTEQWGLAGAVQFDGTFGGSTAKLQASNDGTTWFDMKDLQGTTVSATSAALFEITTSAAYIKPTVTDGSENNVDVILVLRGLY